MPTPPPPPALKGPGAACWKHVPPLLPPKGSGTTNAGSVQLPRPHRRALVEQTSWPTTLFPSPLSAPLPFLKRRPDSVTRFSWVIPQRHLPNIYEFEDLVPRLEVEGPNKGHNAKAVKEGIVKTFSERVSTLSIIRSPLPRMCLRCGLPPLPLLLAQKWD